MDQRHRSLGFGCNANCRNGEKRRRTFYRRYNPGQAGLRGEKTMKIFSGILTLIVLLGAFVFAAEAQTQRRKKTTRRANNTTIRPQLNNSAQIIEPEIVSTAEEIEN